MIACANTRGSTLARLVLTTVFATAAMFVAVVGLGAGSPVGFLLAVPPLYLAWVWLVDSTALVRRGFRASGGYLNRPYYWLWIAGCAVPVLLWLVWISTRPRG